MLRHHLAGDNATTPTPLLPRVKQPLGAALHSYKQRLALIVGGILHRCKPPAARDSSEYQGNQLLLAVV